MISSRIWKKVSQLYDQLFPNLGEDPAVLRRQFPAGCPAEVISCRNGMQQCGKSFQNEKNVYNNKK
jgi:hypothetical protein